MLLIQLWQKNTLHYDKGELRKTTQKIESRNQEILQCGVFFLIIKIMNIAATLNSSSAICSLVPSSLYHFSGLASMQSNSLLEPFMVLRRIPQALAVQLRT